MKNILLLLIFCINLQGNTSYILSHDDCTEFSRFNNVIKNICPHSNKYEVWQSHIGVDSCTPKHKHNAEEIFIFFKGEGRVLIGNKEILYKAPCTVVLPANIEHQIFNTGNIPTDHIVILKKNSLIFDTENNVMHLPWRKSTSSSNLSNGQSMIP